MKVVTMPFEDRFASLLKRLEKYNTIFHEELHIMQFKEGVLAGEKKRTALADALNHMGNMQSTVTGINTEQQCQNETLHKLLDTTLRQSVEGNARDEQIQSSFVSINDSIDRNHATLKQHSEGISDGA
jgi:hypothetical protein